MRVDFRVLDRGVPGALELSGNGLATREGWRETKLGEIGEISFIRCFIIPVYRLSLRWLTLRLLMSYIYGAPSKARNANVVYIWTYVWQR